MTKNKNTKIMVGGVGFDTGIRVVLWNEEEGLSLYPFGKFHARKWSLKDCKKNLKSFYIHHSVTYTAHSTYSGLKSRGLSCNFLIDDDVDPETGCATIYQCLDVKDGGWSQGESHNSDGAGVEICYHPVGDKYTAFFRKKFGVQPHDKVSDRIHGHNFKNVNAPTNAQIKACERLAAAYCVALDLVEEFPKSDGKIYDSIVPMNERRGLLQHFHVKRKKVDAMGFPHEQFEKNVQKLAYEMRNSRTSFLDKVFSVFK